MRDCMTTSQPSTSISPQMAYEQHQGDINDKASLKQAFKGAHSVFAVTNYWEKMDEKLELQQGKNVADVAKVLLLPLLLPHLLHPASPLTFTPGRKHPTPNLLNPLQRQRPKQGQIPTRLPLRQQSPHRSLHPLPRDPRLILHARVLHVEHDDHDQPVASTTQHPHTRPSHAL